MSGSVRDKDCPLSGLTVSGVTTEIRACDLSWTFCLINPKPLSCNCSRWLLWLVLSLLVSLLLSLLLLHLCRLADFHGGRILLSLPFRFSCFATGRRQSDDWSSNLPAGWLFFLSVLLWPISRVDDPDKSAVAWTCGTIGCSLEVSPLSLFLLLFLLLLLFFLLLSFGWLFSVWSVCLGCACATSSRNLADSFVDSACWLSHNFA